MPHTDFIKTEIAGGGSSFALVSEKHESRKAGIEAAVRETGLTTIVPTAAAPRV